MGSAFPCRLPNGLAAHKTAWSTNDFIILVKFAPTLPAAAQARQKDVPPQTNSFSREALLWSSRLKFLDNSAAEFEFFDNAKKSAEWN
jgi:hypothetical protein